GLLELQPHDGVTAALGADAALDPVFPLHLAQIDRLWEAWLGRGGGRANPVQFDWTDETFTFVDADGRARDLTCGQVGDLVNLDYAYDGLPLPGRTERGDGDGAGGSAAGTAVGTIAFPCRGRSRRFVLDVTDAVETLGAEAIAVSFHPALPAGFGPAPAPAARVGRVRLTDG